MSSVLSVAAYRNTHAPFLHLSAHLCPPAFLPVCPVSEPVWVVGAVNPGCLHTPF